MRPTATSAITTGSAATSITDNFSSDTVTVNATALAENTALTLAGSAAETIIGLVGNISAGTLTGAFYVTTGKRRTIDCDHHRLGSHHGYRERRKRQCDGRRDDAGQQHGADARGLGRRER